MRQQSENALHLVRSLLKYCDIDLEEIGDEGKVLVSIDYDITVLVVIEDSLIHFLCTIGPVIESETFYRDLLHANFRSCTQADYSYAIEPESGELLMSLMIQSDGAETNAFIHTFEEFVRYAETWKTSLQAGAAHVPERMAGPPSQEPTGEVAPGSADRMQPEFIKV